MMAVLNPYTGAILATEVKTANTFFTRLKGLMFTNELPVGTALHITPCGSIHTFFMQYSIDVIYLDTQRRIVGLQSNLAPGKLGAVITSAASVLELPAGTLERTQTQVGQQIEFHKQP